MLSPSSPCASLLLLLAALTAGCGAAVTAGPAAPPDDAGADAPGATPTASCAEVQAACGPEPERFVRGHAAGLSGVDGARVRFAIRYAITQGDGLRGARGVAVASGRIRDGGFEACVCVPQGGSWYPEVVAVVFAPGTTGETRREVARAVYSQRYATLGDEDVSGPLGEAPSAPQVEEALAALVERAP